MKEILSKLVERVDLTEAEGAMRTIMEGAATPAYDIQDFWPFLASSG